MARPRDIALAIKLQILPVGESTGTGKRGLSGQDEHPHEASSSTVGTGQSEGEISRARTITARGEAHWDEVEEMFDQVGMEAIDEGGQADEDDERRELFLGRLSRLAASTPAATSGRESTRVLLTMS